MRKLVVAADGGHTHRATAKGRSLCTALDMANGLRGIKTCVRFQRKKKS